MTRSFIASSEARSIMAILRFYDVFFDRAADVEGLRYWVTSLQAGASLNDIAWSFSQSSEYRQRYQGMAEADILESFYNNLFARTSDAAGKAFWLSTVDQSGWSLAQVAAALTVSDESMQPGGTATRFAESYLALRAASGNTPTTQAVAALARQELTEAITGLQTVRGTVQAGTLGHANVYRCIDDTGAIGSCSGALAPVTTDASGHFVLPGGYGSLYAIGGRDMTTGAENTRLLSTVAPAHGGEIVITPLTTLIHALVNRGVDMANAASLVNKAFGIDSGIDLLAFHHLDQAIAADASTSVKRNALIVKGAIAEISILMEGAAALLKGSTKAAGMDAGMDARMVSIRVAEALAEKIATAAAQGRPFQAGTPIRLESAELVAELMASSLDGLAAGTQTARLAVDAAKIVAAFNTPISKIVQLTSGFPAFDAFSMIDALSVIARTEALAMSEMQLLIAAGARDGDLSAEAAALLNRNLGAAIRSSAIGMLAEGVASTRADAVIDRIFNIAPPQDNGGMFEPAPPDFHMTETPGKITFSGSATGDITLAIDGNGSISFWRGGLVASAKSSALSSVVIELPPGQTLRLTNAQLAQIADFTVKGGGNLAVDGALSIASRNAIHFDGFTGAFIHRIQDTPDNILHAAPASLAGAQQVTVAAGSNVSCSVADAATLVARLTDRTGLTLNVVDTASALLANHAIAGVSSYKLSGHASDLSVANAAALVGITGFSANGKTISVLDTAAAMLANHAITGVTAYRLSENAANLSVSNAAALVGINGFDRNGKLITVQDTAAAMLANHAITDVSAYQLSADAVNLSVSNAATLAGITGFSVNGKAFTVRDSAAAIIGNHSIAGVSAYQVIDTHASILNNHAAMAYASGFLLSADAADLSVSHAAALAAVNGFGLNGRAFTVKDSFSAIRAKHDIAGVTRYQLDANTSVANVQTLNSEGLELSKLRFVIADDASAVAMASTSLLNAADSLFSTASTADDNIDLNRSGAITLQINIDLNLGNDTFFGGKGQDYIKGNLGADIIDGGPGRDFYIYSDTGTDSQVSSGGAAAAGFDVVNIAGGDAFYIAAFSAVRTATNVANPLGGSGTDLLAALNGAYASVKSANSDIMFARFIDGSQYLVINDGQDGNTAINAVDTVIKIIGSGTPQAATSNLLLFIEA